MFKFFVVSLVVLATLQVLPTTNAFIVGVQKGFAASSSSAATTTAAPTAAAPAFNPNALIQALQSTIASKLSTIQSLAGRVVQTKQQAFASQLSALQSLASQLVQKKQMAKQSLLKQITSASSGAVSTLQNSLSGASGLLSNKPLFTKTISFGIPHKRPQPGPATTAAPVPDPESTTAAAGVTTTKKPGGYEYRRY